MNNFLYILHTNRNSFVHHINCYVVNSAQSDKYKRYKVGSFWTTEPDLYRFNMSKLGENNLAFTWSWSGQNFALKVYSINDSKLVEPPFEFSWESAIATEKPDCVIIQDDGSKTGRFWAGYTFQTVPIGKITKFITHANYADEKKCWTHYTNYAYFGRDQIAQFVDMETYNTNKILLVGYYNDKLRFAYSAFPRYIEIQYPQGVKSDTLRPMTYIIGNTFIFLVPSYKMDQKRLLNIILYNTVTGISSQSQIPGNSLHALTVAKINDDKLFVAFVAKDSQGQGLSKYISYYIFSFPDIQITRVGALTNMELKQPGYKYDTTGELAAYYDKQTSSIFIIQNFICDIMDDKKFPPLVIKANSYLTLIKIPYIEP